MRLTPTSLIVIRLLLVANGILLAVVALLGWAYFDHPAGVYFALGSAGVSAGLFACVPLTDPYRHRPS